MAISSTFKDTILRTRGSLIGYLDGLSAGGTAVLISVGIWIVPEGTGTTVLASPFSDPNADWFYYSQFVLASEELVADVIDVPAATGYREVIDSKAMRIGMPDTEVQAVFENTTLLGATPVNVNVAGRFLLGQ